MKTQRPIVLPLLALPALFAFSSRGDEVRFAPEAGFTLTKTFSTAEEMTLDEMAVVVNGEEQDPEMMGMDQDISSSMEVVLVDEYVAVSDGRPEKLSRTYDTLGSAMTMKMTNPMMGDMSIEMTGESELEGETVLFSWNGDEYDVEFAEDGGADEELLTDLDEDTDFRDFLPGVAVDEGDTWEVSPEALRPVLAFGGSLKFENETEDSADAMMGFGNTSTMPPPDAFLGDIDGKINAEYRGTREEDGANVAVIQLSVEVTSAKDMTDFFTEAMDDAEMPPEMDMEMSYDSVDMEFELSGEATLLWSLEGAHVHSFAMEGEVSTILDMAMAMSMGGMGDMEFEVGLVMKGSKTISYAASSSGE
ncbi:MAG: hypothetical protein AAF682_24340 [Planctomycetota bacterium]